MIEWIDAVLGDLTDPKGSPTTHTGRSNLSGRRRLLAGLDRSRPPNSPTHRRRRRPTRPGDHQPQYVTADLAQHNELTTRTPDPQDGCRRSMHAKTSWCRRWARYPVSCGNFRHHRQVYPSLNDPVNREPGFTSHLVWIDPADVARRGISRCCCGRLARVSNEGPYGMTYARDLNAPASSWPTDDDTGDRQRPAPGQQGPAHVRDAGTWPMGDQAQGDAGAGW